MDLASFGECGPNNHNLTASMEESNSSMMSPLQDAKEENTKQQMRYDEILIEFLIQNPCLWDKSDTNFRNRTLKDHKWKDIASKMNMAAHEAIRRYKTLCERFRRETIKQSSIPNYVSNWSLFDQFAALKDAQSSDERRSVQRIKMEEPYDADLPDIDALMAAAACASAVNAANAANNTKKRKKPHNNSGSDSTNGCVESSPDTNGAHSEPAQPHNGADMAAAAAAAAAANDAVNYLPGLFDAQSVEDDGDSEECLNVEPSYIGGSTDLSTDSIAAFCQFLEASLKKMATDRSDELIEEISAVLFRKKREIRMHDDQNETISK